MTTLVKDLNDLIEQFEGEKISKSILLDTLLNIVKHEKKSKAILLKNDEFIFLLGWLQDDLHLELEKDEGDYPSETVRKYLPKIIKKMKGA